MKHKKIELLLRKEISLKEIYVDGNENHVNVVIVSSIFNGMSEVKRQQIVYNPLMKHFINEKIHSININAYSLKEWEKEKKN